MVSDLHDLNPLEIKLMAWLKGRGDEFQQTKTSFTKNFRYLKIEGFLNLIAGSSGGRCSLHKPENIQLITR